MSQDFAFLIMLWSIILKDQMKNCYQNIWNQRLNMEMVE